MVAKIRSDGTSSRSAAGEIHSALPKLRDQLQSRGRHGAPLHRETSRRRSRETVERIRQTAVLATITERPPVAGIISKHSIFGPAIPASSRRSRLSPLENLLVWEAHHESVALSLR